MTAIAITLIQHPKELKIAEDFLESRSAVTVAVARLRSKVAPRWRLPEVLPLDLMELVQETCAK